MNEALAIDESLKELLEEKTTDNIDNYELCMKLKTLAPGTPEYVRYSQTIFEKNARLISSIIKRYFYNYLNGKNDIFEELFQQGSIGFLMGLRSYDPEIAPCLSTFIYPFILHEMTEYINKHCKGVTSHYAANQAKINKAITEFESMGKEYTLIDISQKTGLKLESVARALRIANHANLVYYDDDDYLDSQISDHFKSPEQQYLEYERNQAIENALKKLTDDQQKVIRMRMGFDGERMSFREISELMGKTPDELKKLYNDGLRDLKRKREMINMFPDYLRTGKSVLNKSIVAIVPKDYAKSEMKSFEETPLPKFI